MTPATFAQLCQLVGGKARMAQMLGWGKTTVWRKATGRSRITLDDEAEIQLGMKELIYKAQSFWSAGVGLEAKVGDLTEVQTTK